MRLPLLQQLLPKVWEHKPDDIIVTLLIVKPLKRRKLLVWGPWAAALGCMAQRPPTRPSVAAAAAAALEGGGHSAQHNECRHTRPYDRKAAANEEAE